MNTPWGRSDYSRQYTRGFGFVGTPSHGGVYLTVPFAEAHLSPAALQRGERRGGYHFYEEDIGWAIPMWELREFWDEINRVDIEAGMKGQLNEQHLWGTLSRWFPDYLKEIGVEPEPEALARWEQDRDDGRMRRERHPDLVISASGSWATGREGTVIVTTADHRCHLVTEASYDARDAGALNLLSRLDVIERDVSCR